MWEGDSLCLEEIQEIATLFIMYDTYYFIGYLLQDLLSYHFLKS